LSIEDRPTTTGARIAMLIPNLGFGGAQRVFHDHSRLLASRHEVTEVVFNLAEGHAFPSGNPILSLDVAGGGGALAKLRHFRQRIRRLAALKRHVAPALAISHLEGADYVNVLASGPGKTVLVIHGSKLHDANISGPLGWLRRKLMIPRLYNRADRIVTVSYEIATELEAMGVRPDLLRTIHNFFDAAAIRGRSLEPLSAKEQAMFGGPPVLVTSGRLSLQKNQAALLALFADLLKRRPARLLLIGDGELREPLMSQANALGLKVGVGPGGDYDVYFMGFQENPFRFQRHADLFLLTSGWEGFPMVLGEAMACGLPIVSADCPTGPREFLAPNTIGQAVHPLRASEAGKYGMLLPIPAVGDPATIDPWVETLDRLLGDPTERKRLATLSLARADDFSRKVVGSQWLALVDELLDATPATSI
jgi:glycosyltransferase involved in cell wall biosynthesis